MIEEWKPIPGYNGRYYISNIGRVKACLSWDVNKREFISCNRILNPTDNGNGYLIIALRKNCKKQNKYIHRLVAESFVDNPESKRYVNHLDFDTKNNYFRNLAWVSQKENILYSSERMKKDHNCRLPLCGEKFITKRKDGSYEVNAKRKYCGRYKTPEDAVFVRDAELKGGD